jgi:Xaa-Pro aminopeptidase
VKPRQERALEVARRLGADGVLAADPAGVTWLTGLEVDVESGPSPFALPPIAILAADGPPVVVAAADEADAVLAAGCKLEPYEGFTTGPLDPVGRAARALASAAGRRRLASEQGGLPPELVGTLSLVDAGGALAAARAVKDPDEIDRLRAAIALCDVGQREARDRAEPGMTEIELWGLVRAAVERAAGGRTPMLADLASGPRTGETGGAPGERMLAEGDLVLVDLVPRYRGYWGDSCATIALGPPSPAARTKHAAARAALARGVEAIRPGLRADELDGLVRAGLDYPHHSGHGLGTSWHEEPRIVPEGRTRLEPGMVVALEPAVYAGSEGVRVEQVVLVTGDGCEVLSGHSLGL